MLEFEVSAVCILKATRKNPLHLIEVKLFGSAPKEAYDNMTAELCKLYQEVLQITQNRIYIKYEEAEVWGWNGCNF